MKLGNCNLCSFAVLMRILFDFDESEQRVHANAKIERQLPPFRDSENQANDGEKSAGWNERQLKVFGVDVVENRRQNKTASKRSCDVPRSRREYDETRLPLEAARSVHQKLFVVFHAASIFSQLWPVGNSTFVPRTAGEA